MKLFNYIWQPLIAAIFILLLLLVMDSMGVPKLLWAVGSTSVASSAFIVFATPRNEVAKPRCLVGAYMLSFIVGIAMHYCDLFVVSHTYIDPTRIFEVFAGLVVIINMLLMSILRVPHPPAMGIALILVIDPWQFKTLAVLLVGVIILAVLHIFFDKYLINLELKGG